MGKCRNIPILLTVFIACGFVQGWQNAPHEPMALEEGCNPLLGGSDCFLPYPSDVFLVDDESMPSGQRLEILKLQCTAATAIRRESIMPWTAFPRRRPSSPR